MRLRVSTCGAFLRASLLMLLALSFAPALSAQDDPLRDLYRIEAQAQQGGWTADDHRQAAQIWYRRGDYEAAAAHLQAAVTLRPGDRDIQRLHALVNYELQRWPAAIDALRVVIALEPDDRASRYLLGLLLAPLNRETAIPLLESLVDDAAAPLAAPVLEILQSSGDFEQVMQIGLLYAAASEWSLAEYAFTQAAALAGAPEAIAGIGLARTLQGKAGDAWIAQAVEAAPDSALVRYIEGLQQRELRQYPASIAALTRAVALDPNDPRLYATVADVYLDLGDPFSAEFWLNEALVVSNDDPIYQQRISAFYAQYGAVLAEDRTPPQEIVIDPATTRALLGWSLYTEGRTEDALVSLEEALQIDPDNLAALYFQARIALDQGDEATARTLLERVAAADDPLAEEALRLLETLEP